MRIRGVSKGKAKATEGNDETVYVFARAHLEEALQASGLGRATAGSHLGSEPSRSADTTGRSVNASARPPLYDIY